MHEREDKERGIDSVILSFNSKKKRVKAQYNFYCGMFIANINAVQQYDYKEYLSP